MGNICDVCEGLNYTKFNMFNREKYQNTAPKQGVWGKFPHYDVKTPAVINIIKVLITTNTDPYNGTNNDSFLKNIL